jgi:hypothetical protein
VDAHPDAHIGFPRPRMRSERSLRGRGSTDGVACIGEGDEEAIALRIDLATAVLIEYLAEKAPVVR